MTGVVLAVPTYYGKYCGFCKPRIYIDSVWHKELKGLTNNKFCKLVAMNCFFTFYRVGWNYSIEGEYVRFFDYKPRVIKVDI